jgi:F0F1-type ATP synthase delta subunit
VKRLVDLAFSPDGTVREEIAGRILRDLSRSELKRFLTTLTREMARRRVDVALAGKATAAVGSTVADRYPGREVEVTQDELLGAGVRVRAGDDIVDASIRGYIRGIIEKLEGT